MDRMVQKIGLGSLLVIFFNIFPRTAKSVHTFTESGTKMVNQLFIVFILM